MLSIYTTEQTEQWDAIVRSFEKYDTYWLSGYVKAFKIHGDGEPLLFHFDDGNVRGINVVMKRDISLDVHFNGNLEENCFFDFSTPYGYGGWLIEGGSSKKLFEAYEVWCIENGIISEFVRFHPVIQNHITAQNSYETVELGKTIAMKLDSPEVIRANLTSKNRNMIRKAQKNGIRIYKGNYPEIYRVFKEIYDKTMDKDNAEQYYYFSNEFYDSILNDLSNNAQVFFAVYDNKIIAASIMLVSNGKMNYHLSGSLKEYAHMAPTNLLLYEAALWGFENGCKTLYLGGGVGSGEDSLFKFKKAFYRKDTLNSFWIGKKIFNHEKYKYLFGIRGNGFTTSFFPEYRA